MPRRSVMLAAIAVAFAMPADAPAQGEPHAWLYGAWTGGIAPPDPRQGRTACLAAPTVIVTRDIILHQTLLDPSYQQRIVETVRAVPEGVEIRLRPVPPRPAGAPQAGFGCADPNVLRVKREADGSISFPGCLGFPAPLVSCLAK
ncbi:hypothetical protein [Elioraea thermophila]|uniref:hypothetical protein n=1 Tax=Elioraea thermophila TaxID=2185104 RepID=UPI0013004728|nr:hypothetical protein [Elioraea thermophila]